MKKYLIMYREPELRKTSHGHYHVYWAIKSVLVNAETYKSAKVIAEQYANPSITIYGETYTNKTEVAVLKIEDEVSIEDVSQSQ